MQRNLYKNVHIDANIECKQSMIVTCYVHVTCASSVGCVMNTETETMDSCDENGCECKEGFAPPSCCQCDFNGLSGHSFYRTQDGTQDNTCECEQIACI